MKTKWILLQILGLVLGIIIGALTIFHFLFFSSVLPHGGF